MGGAGERRCAVRHSFWPLQSVLSRVDAPPSAALATLQIWLDQWPSGEHMTFAPALVGL